jgi:hypothetical protein
MNVKSMNLVPGRAGLTVWLAYPFVALSGSILSHKNMPSTAGSGEPNSDLDATQPDFDVYQAYQRALADEEVSQRALLSFTVLIQTYRHLPL